MVSYLALGIACVASGLIGMFIGGLAVAINSTIDRSDWRDEIAGDAS